MTRPSDLPTSIICGACGAVLDPHEPPPKYCSQCGRPLLKGQTTRLQVTSFAGTLIERLRSRAGPGCFALADEGAELVELLDRSTPETRNDVVGLVLDWNRRAHRALSQP